MPINTKYDTHLKISYSNRKGLVIGTARKAISIYIVGTLTRKKPHKNLFCFPSYCPN